MTSIAVSTTQLRSYPTEHSVYVTNLDQHSKCLLDLRGSDSVKYWTLVAVMIVIV